MCYGNCTYIKYTTILGLVEYLSNGSRKIRMLDEMINNIFLKNLGFKSSSDYEKPVM